MLGMNEFRQMEKGHAKEKDEVCWQLRVGPAWGSSRKLDQPHDVTDTPPPIICSFSFPLPFFTTFFSAPRERLRRALVRFGRRRKFFQIWQRQKKCASDKRNVPPHTLCLMSFATAKEGGGGGTKERWHEKSFLETLRSTLSEINGSGWQRLANFMEIFKVSPPLL